MQISKDFSFPIGLQLLHGANYADRHDNVYQNTQFIFRGSCHDDLVGRSWHV
jgi:hypothetical protein